jgi:hypothetical protein
MKTLKSRRFPPQIWWSLDRPPPATRPTGDENQGSAAWQIVHEGLWRKLNIESDGDAVGVDYLFKGIRSGGRFAGRQVSRRRTGIVVSAGEQNPQRHPINGSAISQCGGVRSMSTRGWRQKHQVRDPRAWRVGHYDGMEASWTLMAAATYLPLDAWQAKSARTRRTSGGRSNGSSGWRRPVGNRRLLLAAIGSMRAAVNRYKKETGRRGATQGSWRPRTHQRGDQSQGVSRRDGTLSTGFSPRRRARLEIADIYRRNRSSRPAAPIRKNPWGHTCRAGAQ